MIERETAFLRNRCFTLISTALALGCALYCPVVKAHPAHAKPVNYPFIVGFERFYTDLDTPDHLAGGGLILLNELNCVACHSPPDHLKKQLTGRPGTNLQGVGSRFEHLDLEMMIRNPRFVKTDTTMPSLFSGPDRDLDEITALKHFLATLKQEVPEYPEGDIDNGRILYHKVGCVSCHAPEVDYRPPWVAENIEMYLTGLPSVPMNLADRYPRGVLTDLILNPLKYRPSGRMPKFPLSKQEAIDVGAYLNATPKPELPDILLEALNQQEQFQPEQQWIERGRKLFASKNCVACHDGVIAAEATDSIPLVELPVSDSAGCLSERPPGGGVPAYGLDALQKKAILAALERMANTALDDRESAVDWTFSVRNCYACHERQGKGGAESARDIFFTVENRDALPNGRYATHPPSLDYVGAKLTNQAWQSVLYANDRQPFRPFMSVRMPVFESGELADLVADLEVIDSRAFEPVDLGGGDVEQGRELMGIEKENCVACHGLGELPPPGNVSVNLTGITKRLRPGFFHRVVRDPQSLDHGLPMDGSGITDQEVRDIWSYLNNMQSEPLPDGLLLPDVTEQIPENQPLVLRVALQGVSDDALAIGFPGGWNVVFDIETCQWKGWWQGRFIDPGADWNSDEPVALAVPETIRTGDVPEVDSASEFLYYRYVQDGSIEIGYKSGEGKTVATVSRQGVVKTRLPDGEIRTRKWKP